MLRRCYNGTPQRFAKMYLSKLFKTCYPKLKNITTNRLLNTCHIIRKIVESRAIRRIQVVMYAPGFFFHYALINIEVSEIFKIFCKNKLIFTYFLVLSHSGVLFFTKQAYLNNFSFIPVHCTTSCIDKANRIIFIMIRINNRLRTTIRNAHPNMSIICLEVHKKAHWNNIYPK